MVWGNDLIRGRKMSRIRENFMKVRERIEKARQNSRFPVGDVALVVVTKNADVASIREVVACGVDILGENRVQEAYPKITTLGSGVSWHMIGHLQTNKVKRAIELFDVIQSLDSVRLAEALNITAAKLGKKVKAFVEVKVSHEATKFGFPREEVLAFLEQAAHYDHIEIEGLMAMAPYFGDPEAARPYFAMARDLFHKARETKFPWISMKYLSMGMSHDFEVAISEGANMVRIGRAIFSGDTT